MGGLQKGYMQKGGGNTWRVYKNGASHLVLIGWKGGGREQHNIDRAKCFLFWKTVTLGDKNYRETFQ